MLMLHVDGVSVMGDDQGEEADVAYGRLLRGGIKSLQEELARWEARRAREVPAPRSCGFPYCGGANCTCMVAG